MHFLGGRVKFWQRHRKDLAQVKSCQLCCSTVLLLPLAGDVHISVISISLAFSFEQLCLQRANSTGGLRWIGCLFALWWTRQKHHTPHEQCIQYFRQ